MLFTQFSFASWVGNDADETLGALEKKDEIRHQIRVLQPDKIVPFASYVYFCNEENQRMNAWVNTPQQIQDMGIPGMHFMYPGDVWNLEENESMSLHALARYNEDFKRPKVIDPTPPSVSTEKLLNGAKSCMASLVQYFGQKAKKLPPFRIYITDLNKILVFAPAAGNVALEGLQGQEEWHMAMCSQVAWYTFNFSWGGKTLTISGMFRAPLWVIQNEPPVFRMQRRLSSQHLAFDTPIQSLRTARWL